MEAGERESRKVASNSLGGGGVNECSTHSTTKASPDCCFIQTCSPETASDRSWIETEALGLSAISGTLAQMTQQSRDRKEVPADIWQRKGRKCEGEHVLMPHINSYNHL